MRIVSIGLNIPFGILQLLSSNIPNRAWQLVSIKKKTKGNHIYNSSIISLLLERL